MAFVFHNAAPGSGEAYILVDMFGRMQLSSALRKKLGIVPGAPFKCHLAFDPDTGNIGLARPGEVAGIPESYAPASFDRKRYYASVRSFIKRWHLRPGRYVYIERQHNIYVFRREDVMEP